MNPILVVFRKEVRENIRDRRTLLNTLLVGPLLMPVLFVVLINTQVTRSLEKADEPLQLPVIGAEHAPNLIQALKQQGVIIKPGPADPEHAVRDRDADVVLRIPDRFADDWSQGQPAQVEIVYDESQRDNSSSVTRLRAMLDAYGSRTGTLRLLARGMSPTVQRPLLVAERDQSTAQSRSGIIFGFLPFTFIFAALIGGLALAVDTTAGERERQSLEPLLANPVSAGRILLGKLSATATFSIMTVLLSLLAFTVSARFMPVERLGMSLTIGPRFIIGTFFVMIPLAVAFSTLQTLVASFANSYREAQAYLSMIMLIPILPTVVLTVLPLKVRLFMYAIPLMGQQITITRLVRGDHIGLLAFGTCFACTALLALVLYLVTARLYRSERLAIAV